MKEKEVKFMGNQDNIRNQIYLGALLHDIGKFWQRADETFFHSELKDHIKKLSDLTNKTQSGHHTHQHAFWTLQFLENKNYVFEKLGLNNKEITLPNLAAYHHKPKNEYEAFIQLGDWWASGIDRSVFNEEKVIAHNDKEQYKKIPLVSIFNKIRVKGNTNLNPKSYQVQKLSITKLFPQDYNHDYLNSQNIYKKLWDEFYSEFDKLPKKNFKNFSISLYYLLKKYLWFIPASTIDYPDSNLFQHSKLTAAFAQCFYDYQRYKGNKAFDFDTSRGRLHIKNSEYPVVLLGVDLSGIQSFLYNISSKYAAKSLRGRSFHLQMLIEGLSWKIIERTDTTPSHIIYNSGGKFFILLPNTQKIKSDVNILFEQIEKDLWQSYEGALSINTFMLPFAYENLSQKDHPRPNIRVEGIREFMFLGEMWQLMHEGLNKKKNSKYRELFLDEFDHFFENAKDQGGKTIICSVTAKEMTEDERERVHKKINDEAFNDINISEEVFVQKEIGEELVGHTHIAFNQTFEKDSRNVFDLPFDYSYSIREKGFIPGNCISLKSVRNDKDFNFLEPNLDTAQGFRFFGGIDTPILNRKQKSFEELAGAYEFNGEKIKDNNYPRIGFLRMDVDNLGLIFLDGFAKENQSFSAFASLSAMLDLFFSAHLNIIRNDEKYRNHVTIIYSGGDDLFAVGRWDKIFEFAAEVRNKFTEFTGRDDISISGGIEIYTPKFPVAKAAKAAGAAEEHAKQFNNNDKNAICLFGIPVSWGEEYDKVLEWKNKLVDWLNTDTISKGLLMALFRYYNIYQNDKTNLSWKWNATYNLARRAKALEKQPEKRAAIDEIKNLIFTEINKNRFRFEAFAVAMRWAELIDRMKTI